MPKNRTKDAKDSTDVRARTALAAKAIQLARKSKPASFYRADAARTMREGLASKGDVEAAASPWTLARSSARPRGTGRVVDAAEGDAR